MSPVRLVVGFSPGSASDQIGCAIAPGLTRALGRTVDVDLRPGRNGAIAACQVAAAVPDGRTLFMATLGTHALAPHLDAALAYDPLIDFASVALVAAGPLVLACHPSLDVSNARELIELARDRSRMLTYGTSAIGGAPHLAAELFQSLSGVEMCHVRYERTEQLYADLEAGRIDLSFNNIMSTLPRCFDGRLRALGVTSACRNPAAPGVPTLAESGLAGYDMSNWLGVVAPRDVSVPLIEELRAAIATTLKTAEIANAFHTAGVTPGAGTPAEFRDFIADEIARWGPVVARFRDTAATHVRAPAASRR